MPAYEKLRLDGHESTLTPFLPQHPLRQKFLREFAAACRKMPRLAEILRGGGMMDTTLFASGKLRASSGAAVPFPL